MLKTYIVQARFAHGGILERVGQFKAHTCLGAIVQAAQSLKSGGVDVVEVVATEEE